jgi:hypothetical protein
MRNSNTREEEDRSVGARSPRRGTSGAGVPAALRWRSRVNGDPVPCCVVRLLFEGGATRERDQANAIRKRPQNCI